MTDPLVTVITPTYNRGRTYLTETIDSVLAQDYPNFEYLVLDDGSTDNTREVVAQYDDPRLQYHYHDNMGVVRTVNKGFGMARGEFVTVVNSDDPVLPGFLSEMVRFLQARPQLIGAYPDWLRIDSTGQIIEHVKAREYNFLDSLRHYICYQGPGTVFRSSLLQKVGLYNPDTPTIFDYEFYMLAGMVGEFRRVPQTLAAYRTHGGTLTVQRRGERSDEYIRVMCRIFASPHLTHEAKNVKRQAFASAHYLTGIQALDFRAYAGYHFFRSLAYFPGSYRPVESPRPLRIMVLVIILGVIPFPIRLALKRILGRHARAQRRETP